MFEPSERMKRLYGLLSQIPPEYDAARRMLEAEKPGEEELAWLAAELVNDTFGEYRDWLHNGAPMAVPGKRHRDYLYQVIELLLEQGLNPNAVVQRKSGEKENALMNLCYTDGPDVAAKTMRLLLEHGADSNVYVDLNTPLTSVDEGMHIAPIYERWFFDNLVQCAMVLQAYGGYWIGGDKATHTPFLICGGDGAEMFKEFEKFDYSFGNAEGHPGYVHIFNKDTGEIVADYI